MMKKTFMVLTCFISIIIFISTLHGQSSKKTITLSSGEVVWDLNGEWDVLSVNLGTSLQHVWPTGWESKSVLRITQQGGSFTGVKMSEGGNVPKDAVSITGELDKNGIKKFRYVIQTSIDQGVECKGQIDEGGNKIIVESDERIRVTLTRK